MAKRKRTKGGITVGREDRPPVDELRPAEKGKRLGINSDPVPVDDARRLPRFRGR